MSGAMDLTREQLERMARIEEELKAQRELMQQGFAAMEKRFEQADGRFEDSRYHTNVWMTALTIIIAATGFAGPVLAAMVTG